MTFLSEFIDGGPHCMRDDCMITENGTHTTSAYFPPVYDAQGRNTNPDMNKTFVRRRCLSCGKAWEEVWQNGVRISSE